MSVVLDKPRLRYRTPVTDVPLVLRPRVPVQPGRPAIDVPRQTPTRVKPRTGVRVGHFFVMKGMLFAMTFGITYVASTLSGMYLVEQSRTQGIEASARAKYAMQSEKTIQRTLDTLRSATTVEDWAIAHGFLPADGLGQTSKVQDIGATNK